MSSGVADPRGVDERATEAQRRAAVHADLNPLSCFIAACRLAYYNISMFKLSLYLSLS